MDVAKDEVVACVRLPDGRGGQAQEVRTFQTFTSGLEALADWLTAEGVVQVVMEATGVYWKAQWAILEDEFDCMWSTPGTSSRSRAARPRGCPVARRTWLVAVPCLVRSRWGRGELRDKSTETKGPR